MVKFKYIGKEHTRVKIPGVAEKVTVKEGEIVDVDGNHKDYKEIFFITNDFIVVKMQDTTAKQVTPKKSPKK